MSNLRDELTEYCKSNNRVCPLPDYWMKLYEMLPGKKRKGSGWEPSLPLILGAWWETSSIEKIIRLSEHIEWAEKLNVLDKVSNFLYSLSEDQWFHIGD